MDAAPQPWLIEVAPVGKAKRSLWQQWQSYSDDWDTEGGLLGPAQAAKLLGVNRSRVYQLMEAGKLRTFDHFGHVYVSGQEVMKRAMEPKDVGGRPRQLQAA